MSGLIEADDQLIVNNQEKDSNNSTKSTLLTKLVMFWSEVIGQRAIQNRVAQNIELPDAVQMSACGKWKVLRLPVNNVYK